MSHDWGTPFSIYPTTLRQAFTLSCDAPLHQQLVACVCRNCVWIHSTFMAGFSRFSIQAKNQDQEVGHMWTIKNLMLPIPVHEVWCQIFSSLECGYCAGGLSSLLLHCGFSSWVFFFQWSQTDPSCVFPFWHGSFQMTLYIQTYNLIYLFFASNELPSIEVQIFVMRLDNRNEQRNKRAKDWDWRVPASVSCNCKQMSIVTDK